MKALYLCPREARQGMCKGIPPFPQSIRLSHFILILQRQEKSAAYRSCRAENAETAYWHAHPWHLRVMVMLAVLTPAVCWGCSALHTCMKRHDLDHRKCCDHLPVYFQSWKLAAGWAGRKVTLSPHCSCHLQSLLLKAWNELPKISLEDWLFLRVEVFFSTTRDCRPTCFGFQQEKQSMDFSGIFHPSEAFWGRTNYVNPVLG